MDIGNVASRGRKREQSKLIAKRKKFQKLIFKYVFLKFDQKSDHFFRGLKENQIQYK